MPTLEDIFLLKSLFEKQLVNFENINTPLRLFAEEKRGGKNVAFAEILARLGTVAKADLHNLQKEVQEDLQNIRPEQFLSLPNYFDINECERKGSIGKSALGVTYKAFHNSFKDCVIKCLEGPIAQNRRFLKRFFAQLEKLKNLAHANLSRVYFVSYSNLVIAREFVNGKSLQELIDDGSLSIQDSCSIILQAAKALEFSLECGVVHKNLKPNNIIVDNKIQAKVVDFSLPPTLSLYLSPEQCQKQKSDFRSDIYSLGVIFYNMLTGKVLYEGSSSKDIMNAHVAGQYKAIKDVNSSVSSDIVNIVKKMLEADLSERYETYSELIKDLEKQITQETPSPRKMFKKAPLNFPSIPRIEAEKSAMHAVPVESNSAVAMAAEEVGESQITAAEAEAEEASQFEEDEAMEAFATTNTEETMEAMSANETMEAVSAVEETLEAVSAVSTEEAMEAMSAEDMEAMADEEEAMAAEALDSAEEMEMENEEKKPLSLPEEKDFEIDFSDNAEQIEISNRPPPKMVVEPLDSEAMEDLEEWGPGLRGDDGPEKSLDLRRKPKVRPYFSGLFDAVKDDSEESSEKEQKPKESPKKSEEVRVNTQDATMEDIPVETFEDLEALKAPVDALDSKEETRVLGIPNAEDDSEGSEPNANDESEKD